MHRLMMARDSDINRQRFSHHWIALELLYKLVWLMSAQDKVQEETGPDDHHTETPQL